MWRSEGEYEGGPGTGTRGAGGAGAVRMLHAHRDARVAVRVWHVVDQAVRGKRSGTPSRVKTSGKRAAGKRSASNRPRAITKSTFETF